MKRRDFLTTSCAVGVTAVTSPLLHAVETPTKRFFIDFRQVTVPNLEKRKKFIDYNAKTLTPILNEFGISKIGMFTPDTRLNSMDKNYDTKFDSVVFSVIPHPSFDSILQMAEKIVMDPRYTETYSALSEGTSSKNPLFTRHERSLLYCFKDFPEIEVPSLAPDRVLQLRIYRSYNFERNRAKVSMFTEGGELAMFRECDMNPVFFSTMYFGTQIPCIVYMLSFESEGHMKEAWAKFGKHPDWPKLRDAPAYADTATEITNIYLRPCEGSQI